MLWKRHGKLGLRNTAQAAIMYPNDHGMIMMLYSPS